ncbi:unnamed protein product [Linum trigynum]|uniref:S-protein homolog n=1 Tax=Linum trigynum TaxID=586398 RepID=A0AAV2DPI3_9ROSI
MRTAAASIAATTWIMMAILLLMGTPSNAEEEEGIIEKTVVKVTNGLKVQLTAHCKSKDDDLGEKVLTTDGFFSWKFYPNVLPTTLYFCSFEWDGSGGNKSFNIYVESRDDERCTHCQWTIYEKGPCLYDGGTKVYDICYPFDS